MRKPEESKKIYIDYFVCTLVLMPGLLTNYLSLEVEDALRMDRVGLDFDEKELFTF